MVPRPIFHHQISEGVDHWHSHHLHVPRRNILRTIWEKRQELPVLAHMTAECVKECTRLKRNWRNICLTMLNIAPTNVLSVKKDLNSLAIWINIFERIQMRGHSLVRCAENPLSKLVSLNSTCGSTQERSLIIAPSAIVLSSKLAS